MRSLYSAKPVFPFFGVFSSILVIVFGLLFAPCPKTLFFLGSAWILFLVFGSYKACFFVLPFMFAFGAIFYGLTFLISKEFASSLAAFTRIACVFVAVIPGLSVPPVNVVRSISSLKVKKSFRPVLRTITLGLMITLSFFPILAKEIAQVKEAVQTRGSGSVFSPKIFYRAFLIPLVIRLVNICDTLSLSVETRGFSLGEDEYSVFKQIKLNARDFVFIFLVFVLCALLVLAVLNG